MNSYLKSLERRRQWAINQKENGARLIIDAEQKIADFDAAIAHELSLTPEQSELESNTRCEERRRKFAEMMAEVERNPLPNYSPESSDNDDNYNSRCPTCGMLKY